MNMQCLPAKKAKSTLIAILPGGLVQRQNQCAVFCRGLASANLPTTVGAGRGHR